jgi:gliding motility-associated-like protein
MVLRAFLAIAMLVVITGIYAQPPCDPPLEASVSVSGPVCAGGTVIITFNLDDDEDDMDVYYSIAGIQYVAEDQDDDFTVEYVATTNTTVVLQYIIVDDDCITVFNQTVNITVSNPSLSLSSTNPGCNQSNGVIVATAYNGIPPYQYSLNGGGFQSNNTFSGLGPGTYTVTVKDDINCTAQQTVTLSEPPSPTLSTTQSNPSCGQNNGSITASASGGTPPYQFQLNNGPWQSSGNFSGLGAGTYTVTVRDNNNCTASTTVTLTNPGAPTLSTTQSNPSCGQNNGSITASASGGTPPYQFQLNNGPWQSSGNFSGLGAGTYTVTVRDAEVCVASTMVSLSPATTGLPAAAISYNTLTGCQGTTFQLSGNLPAGTTGRWDSDEITPPTGSSPTWTITNAPIGTTIITWTLSASGCPNYSSATIELIVLPPPVANDDGIFSVQEGQTMEAPVLTNDLFSLPVSVRVLRQPSQGNAIFSSQNLLIYIPLPNADGLDSVAYELCYAACPDACDTALVIFRNIRTEDPCLITGDTSYVFTNGLTPNGDGRNDYLVSKVVSIENCAINYAQSEIIIYNRWGDIIYEASPYKNDWGGKNQRGEDLPPGVYYFILRIRLDKTYTQFGSVILVR